MSDVDTKYQRSASRKRSIMAKALRDQGDHKGAFSMKIIDSRKQEYKRKKVRVMDVYEQDPD